MRVVLGIIVGVVVGFAIAFASFGRPTSPPPAFGTGVGREDAEAEAIIRTLYDQEHQNLLRMDIAGQERFLPDDFVVTNPFNMFIGKQQVVERLRTDIIKYNQYEREYEYFRRYGDTMVVVGTETVTPAPDAARADAGQTTRRRFTEFWVLREGGWEKVVRHASNITS